jgi:protein O-GlcNAc transferase
MAEPAGGGPTPNDEILFPVLDRVFADAARRRLRLGRFPEAEQALRRWAALVPDDPGPWLELAQLWTRNGRADDGLGLTQRAQRLAPRLTGGHLARAFALTALGRPAEAEAAVTAALAQDPLHPPALLRLGEIRIAQARLDDAVVHLAQAVAAAPQWAETHAALGQALRGLGMLHAAAAALATAGRLEPGRVEAGRRRAAALFEAGKIDDGLAVLDALAPLDPQPALTGSIRLFSLNLDDRLSDEALSAAHRAWGEQVTAGLPPAVPPVVDRDPERRLRIGFVAADVRRHPVGYMLEAALRHRDPAAVETVIYAGNQRDDALTDRLRGLCDGWRACAGWSDERLAAVIREDRIDILVDLSGHAGGNRLPVFARKPAPVQVSWLDYFNTTGLPAMDYALFDAVSVPDGRESLFTEQVARLPDGRFCYTPPEYAPDAAPPPALTRGYVTFGSFNSLQKLNEATIALWSRVLRAVPGSRLLLKTATLLDVGVQIALRLAFRRHGIAAAQVMFRGRSDHAAMLAEYADVDIALDPLTYNGGITSCEALWMGVPVLTWPGDRPVARQTLGFLTALGLNGELAASGADDYVARAVGLAVDTGRLAELRASLRPRMASSSLCDGARFAGRLETAWRLMWRRYAAGLPAEGFTVPAASAPPTAKDDDDGRLALQEMLNRAAAHHMAGRLDAARRGYDRLLDRLPTGEYFTPLYLSALLEMDAGAPAAALERLQRIPANTVTEAYTRSTMALASLMLGDTAAATDGFAVFLARRGEVVDDAAALGRDIDQWRRFLDFAGQFRHLKGAVGLGLGEAGYAAEPVSAACPACGGTSARRLFSVTATQAAQHFAAIHLDPPRFERLRRTLDRLWGGKPCRMLKCEGCGLGFADPFVAGDADFYELTSSDALYPENKWEFDATLAALRRLTPGDPTQGLRVLEVGSGQGAFLRKLSPALTPPGNVHFAEYVAGHRARLTDEGFIPFDSDRLRRPPVELCGVFDAVCAFQVLEHNDRLDAWVDGLSALLRPGGSLFFAAPGTPFTEFAERNGAGLDLPPNHISRWTPAAFAAFARRRGLELVACAFDDEDTVSRRRLFDMLRFARDSQIPGSVAQAINMCPPERLRMQLMTQMAQMYEVAHAPLLAQLAGPVYGASLWAHLVKPL